MRPKSKPMRRNALQRLKPEARDSRRRTRSRGALAPQDARRPLPQKRSSEFKALASSAVEENSPPPNVDVYHAAADVAANTTVSRKKGTAARNSAVPPNDQRVLVLVLMIGFAVGRRCS